MTDEVKETKDPKVVINQAYDQWEKAVDTLIEQAEKGYMPLVASSLKLSKEILVVYRKAFLEGIDNKELN